jgi:hypothetical protein
MLEISRSLHSLDYWDDLDPIQMKELWQQALSARDYGYLEDFFADIQ